jgi:ribosomal-protein-alanine N-acetyltransferase|tara:strand:+ start:2883 stop:3380 length:498 start_codon:yes stop_codon:yes gene_type:complete
VPDARNNVRIRFATSKDIAEVISINFKTLPEHYSNSFFMELLLDSPETFVVAENNNKIIGYIMCRIEYGFSILKKMSLARKGHVVSFAVLEEYRGKGIGKKLVVQSIEGMKIKKCNESYLEVRTDNIPAIKLYENLGFNKIATLNTYYKDGRSAFLMSSKLNRNN